MKNNGVCEVLGFYVLDGDKSGYVMVILWETAFLVNKVIKLSEDTPIVQITKQDFLDFNNNLTTVYSRT